MSINIDHELESLIPDNNILKVSANGSLIIPIGANNQRPAPSANGQIRFNSDTNIYEMSRNNQWVNFGVDGGNAPKRSWFNKVNIQSVSNALIDDTNNKPTQNNGIQIWQQSLQPLFVESRFQFIGNIVVDVNSNNTYVTLAVFRNNECVAVSTCWIDVAGTATTLGVTFLDAPYTTNNINYMIRIGTHRNTGLYINRTRSQGSLYGNLLQENGFMLIEV